MLIGQNYFYSNFYSMFASNLIGLILVLTVPTILDVLVFTNKSSDPYSAFRRYLDTIRHMLRWYRYDVTNLKSKNVEKIDPIPTYSERSEECIDFTMIITSRNNAPISNYGGGFRCKSEYPWCIIE
ncbi:DUF2236 domain-containing protein, partial [Aphis craccivora]